MPTWKIFIRDIKSIILISDKFIASNKIALDLIAKNIDEIFPNTCGIFTSQKKLEGHLITVRQDEIIVGNEYIVQFENLTYFIDEYISLVQSFTKWTDIFSEENEKHARVSIKKLYNHWLRNIGVIHKVFTAARIVDLKIYHSKLNKQEIRFHQASYICMTTFAESTKGRGANYHIYIPKYLNPNINNKDGCVIENHKEEKFQLPPYHSSHNDLNNTGLYEPFRKAFDENELRHIPGDKDVLYNLYRYCFWLFNGVRLFNRPEQPEDCVCVVGPVSYVDFLPTHKKDFYLREGYKEKKSILQKKEQPQHLILKMILINELFRKGIQFEPADLDPENKVYRKDQLQSTLRKNKTSLAIFCKEKDKEKPRDMDIVLDKNQKPDTFFKLKTYLVKYYKKIIILSDKSEMCEGALLHCILIAPEDLAWQVKE